MAVQKYSDVGLGDCDLLVVVYNCHSSAAGRDRIGPIGRRCRTGTTRPRIILRTPCVRLIRSHHKAELPSLISRMIFKSLFFRNLIRRHS